MNKQHQLGAMMALACLTSEPMLGFKHDEVVGPSMYRLQYPNPRTKPVAGRNELCPCGSSKKYKRCCRGKEMQGPLRAGAQV